MITANALVAECEVPLEQRWGYIWGTSGETWTKEKQENTKNEMAQKYGAQWIGRRVCDCSGLLVYAFRQLGGSIYHGSNTIWRSYCVNSTKSVLKNGKRPDGKAVRPGSAVFLNDGGSRHHVGIYIGSNLCIEAKGTRSGVVSSSLAHWDEVAELKDVSYDGEAVLMTLRRGCRGQEVTELQTELIRLGYDCGTADGIFGKRTDAAVRLFQQDRGLSADGVVGEKTWAALNANGTKDPPDTEAKTGPSAPECPPDGEKDGGTPTLPGFPLDEGKEAPQPAPASGTGAREADNATDRFSGAGETEKEEYMIDFLPAVLQTLTDRAAALENKARTVQQEAEALAERVEALLRLLEGEDENE